MSATYLQELNNIQQQAVTTTEGPVLIIAGPGSGKTRVLTYRIAHLLNTCAAPWEILALTFTNKAAKEMKERIEKVIGGKADRVWAGTFHSIFARILRREAEKIGYPSNFTIYDSDDTIGLISTIIKEFGLDTNVYNANSIRTRISSAKSNLITPKAYAQNQKLIEEDRIHKRPFLLKIYEQYVARCARAGAMDFDDLLYRLFELFQKHPDICDKYRQQFKYVLVDEFQDTNFLQYAILKKMALYEGSPRNICVVGDDAQSIYAFRGATIDNILDFEKDFKGLKIFKLEQNYRSTTHIVQAANEVISFNRKQIQKEIWTDKKGGNKIKVIKVLSDNEEGKRVADIILEQKNRHHLNNKDIVILYRTNAQSRIFEEFLRRQNIPYRIYGGLSFYHRKEVKDVLAYLRLIVNPNDEEALRRIINYPRRGIGDTSLEKISKCANETNQTMWSILPQVELGAAAKRATADFVKLIQFFQQKAEKSNAYEVAYYVVKQAGIMEDLKSDTTEEGLTRIENINGLLDGIKDFVENDELFEEENVMTDKSLTSYLQTIALHTDADDDTGSSDFITLMSVHSAKGLEFKSVFVTGLEESLFPSYLSKDSPDALDEERRLFYVAITRAEQFLTLTYSNSRYRFGQMRNNPPSRFLEEISAQNLETSPNMRTPNLPEIAPRAAIAGKFTAKKPDFAMSPIEIANFKPSAPNLIHVGMNVLHTKFGKGKVLSIEGEADNRVATIHFEQTDDPKKRIFLKFAKLEII